MHKPSSLRNHVLEDGWWVKRDPFTGKVIDKRPATPAPAPAGTTIQRHHLWNDLHTIPDVTEPEEA